MQQVIAIEVKEVAIPTDWHTASECRARVESWEKEELKKCISTIMKAIWERAGNGHTNVSVPVKSSRSIEFYEALKAKMEELGFKVVPPASPRNLIENSCSWLFGW